MHVSVEKKSITKKKDGRDLSLVDGPNDLDDVRVVNPSIKSNHRDKNNEESKSHKSQSSMKESVSQRPD